MNIFKNTRLVTVAAFVILALLGTGIVAAMKHHSQLAKGSAAQNAAAKTTKKPPAPESSGAGSTPAAPAQSSSPADKAVAAAGTAQPVTAACKLLTAGAAQQILGGSAQPVSAGDTSAVNAAATSVTGCGYENENGSVQLIIRAPTSQLGISENATVFGSAKPAGAVTVQGYGDAAFWDPAKHTLNILGSNNWYIIARSSNTQADAEAAAKLLAPGF